MSNESLNNRKVEFDDNPFARKSYAKKKESWGGQFPQEYVNMVYTIASRYAQAYKSTDLKDTMVQELFLSLCKIKDDPRFIFKAYVSATLSGESKHIWKRWAKGSELADVDKFDQDLHYNPQEEIDNQLDVNVTTGELNQAIDELTEFEKWILTKRFLEKKKFTEILDDYNKGKTKNKQMKSLPVFHAAAQSALIRLRSILKHTKQAIAINPFDKVIE